MVILTYAKSFSKYETKKRDFFFYLLSEVYLNLALLLSRYGSITREQEPP